MVGALGPVLPSAAARRESRPFTTLLHGEQEEEKGPAAASGLYVQSSSFYFLTL